MRLVKYLKSHILVTICIITLVIYIPFLFYFRHKDTMLLSHQFSFPVYQVDSEGYARLADNLINFHGFNRNRAAPYRPEDTRTPGYPIILALSEIFFGNFLAVIILQIFLVAATAYLIFKIGQKLMSEWLGFFSALLYILNPATIRFTLMVLTDVVFVFLFVLSVYLLFFKDSKKNYLINFFAGLALGYAVLVRPVGAFLPILMIPFYFFFIKASFTYKRCLILSSVFLLGFILIMAPWVIRNKILFDRWSISSITTATFFRFNIPQFLSFKYGVSLEEARQLIEKSVPDTPLRPKELSDLMNATIQHYFAMDPLGYIKFHLIGMIPFFVGPTDSTLFLNNISSYLVFHDISNFEMRLVEDLGILIPIWENYIWAVISGFMIVSLINFRHNKFVIFFWSIVLYFAFMTSVDFQIRYRLPVEPFMFLLAVWGFSLFKSSLYEDLKNIVKRFRDYRVS